MQWLWPYTIMTIVGDMVELESESFSQSESAQPTLGSRPGMSTFYAELVNLLVVFQRCLTISHS